jgi:hypothetical protein
MTPQEKAEELVLTYLRIDNNTKEWFNKHIAKRCALIAVEEIFKTGLLEGSTLGINKKYWQEVKKEIEKL